VLLSNCCFKHLQWRREKIIAKTFRDRSPPLREEAKGSANPSQKKRTASTSRKQTPSGQRLVVARLVRSILSPANALLPHHDKKAVVDKAKKELSS
jgi:hypothetical protein